MRRSKLRAIRIAGTHARRGGVSLPRYAIVSSVNGMLQHIVWIVHGHYPTLHYAPAIDGGIDDAILIPLGERRVADIAAEAVHMKDQVPGAHHQLVGANGGQAAGTAACNKKTARKRKKSNLNNSIYLSNYKFALALARSRRAITVHANWFTYR